MSHPFLSAEWIDAARSIRERHAASADPITTVVKLNLVVNGAPFDDEQVTSHVDTSSGALEFELGALADPDVTVTTDYETAKALFLATDPAAGMQAFMAGKLLIQGDMMKLMVLPTLAAADPAARAASEEIKAITA
jgi:hypothetical protein